MDLCKFCVSICHKINVLNDTARIPCVDIWRKHRLNLMQKISNNNKRNLEFGFLLGISCGVSSYMVKSCLGSRLYKPKYHPSTCILCSSSWLRCSTVCAGIRYFFWINVAHGAATTRKYKPWTLPLHAHRVHYQRWHCKLMEVFKRGLMECRANVMLGFEGMVKHGPFLDMPTTIISAS